MIKKLFFSPFYVALLEISACKLKHNEMQLPRILPRTSWKPLGGSQRSTDLFKVACPGVQQLLVTRGSYLGHSKAGCYLKKTFVSSLKEQYSLVYKTYQC